MVHMYAKTYTGQVKNIFEGFLYILKLVFQAVRVGCISPRERLIAGPQGTDRSGSY